MTKNKITQKRILEMFIFPPPHPHSTLAPARGAVSTSQQHTAHHSVTEGFALHQTRLPSLGPGVLNSC